MNVLHRALIFVAFALLLIGLGAQARADEGHAAFFRADAELAARLHPAERVRAPSAAGRMRGASPRLVEKVSSAARRHGVPVAIAKAVVTVESGWRCHARSPAGARGIAQVLPATARSVGVHGNLFDCATSIEAGMRYLRLAIDRAGPTCAGVGLYERGIYASPRCTAYGRRVMAIAGGAR
jgi:soluble lytic murein transglycosylase-like protein